MDQSGSNPSVSFGQQLHGFAAISANKTSVGKYEYVQFTATLPATATGCYWDFGDGTTANTTTALKNWTAQGKYTIKLVIIDGNGKTTSVVKANFITVSNSVTQFPLDSGTVGMTGTPKQVFSFRQLLATATLCVRIRRGSDNVEMDFGFTNQGYLDTAAISTFLNGATGYIRTWYDQSGTADQNQTTVTQQPQIDISGTYAKAVYVLGSSTTVSALSIAMGATRNFVQNSLCAVDSAATNDTNNYNVWSIGSSGGAFVRLINAILSGTVSYSTNYNMGSGGTGVNAVSSVAKGAWSSVTQAHDTASKVYFMLNSNLQNPGGTATSNDNNSTLPNPTVNSNALSPQYNHWIREAIIITGTSDYSYIDNLQKAYYTDRI